MIKIITSFILVFSLIFHSLLLSAAEVTSNQFTSQLFLTGHLDLTDLPAQNIFLEQTKCSKLEYSSSLDQNLKLFCNVVTKSDHCKSVAEKDLLNCNHPATNPLKIDFDYIKGCLTGLFHSAKDFLNLVYEIMKFIFDNVTSFDKATETATKFSSNISAFSQSIKLYMYTEYDKAYDKAPYPKGMNAAAKVAENALTFIAKGFFDSVSKSYYEFGCLNSEAKSERLCKTIGDFIIPPAALMGFIKKGAEAAKTFPAVEKALSKLKNFSKFAPYLERLNNAKRILGREVTEAQQAAIIAAHLVGTGEKGANGSLAQIGNYTKAQLRQKAKLLKDAGLSSEEIRKLMEAGIVGLGPEEIKAAGSLYSPTKIPLATTHTPFNNPYISFTLEHGNRLPAKIESIDPLTHVVTVRYVKEDGTQALKTLTEKEYATARNSDNASKLFQELGNEVHSSLKIPPHASSDVESVRRALREGVAPSDPYVSFKIGDGERSAAKILNVDKSSGKVTVELLDGRKLTIEGEDLASLRQSSSSKGAFLNPVNPIRLESHTESTYQSVREALNSGVVPKDPYVSLTRPGFPREAAKILKVDRATGEVTLKMQAGETIKVQGEVLESMRQSSSAREAMQLEESATPVADQRSHASEQKPTEDAALHPVVTDSTAEIIKKYALEPKLLLETKGAKYKVGSFFTDGEGRIFSLVDVTVNGKTTRRVFYRSNSSASFRNLPARNMGMGGMFPGYDKGFGEEFLSARSELQAFLSSETLKAPPIGQLPKLDPKDLEGIIPVNRSIEDYQKYHNAPDSIYSYQKRSREITSDTERHLSSPGGHDYASPEKVVIANKLERPNFNNPKSTYTLKTEIHGELKAYVYPSVDGKLEYTLLKDSSGRVWFSDIGSTVGEITSHGLSAEGVIGHELITPRWEYREQIPKGYAGVANPNNPKYKDAWSYIKEFPEIKRWYHEQGLPIPD